MADASEDPFVGSNFTLEVNRAPVASFTEFSGIKLEVEAIESIENDVKGVQRIRKIAGRYKPGAFTLKRPLDSDMQFYDWFCEALPPTNPDGKRDMSKVRDEVSLVVYDTAGNEKARWNLVNTWISGYDSGSVKASDNAVMSETITMQCETMIRVKK
jgi:phage tail-like protein